MTERNRKLELQMILEAVCALAAATTAEVAAEYH